MSGSYLLAIAYESLKNNLLLKKDNILVNSILLLIAVLFSLYFSSRKNIYKKGVFTVTLLAFVMTIVYGFISLKFFYRNNFV